MKLFEQFLHDMNERGVIVLLCAVRPDFAQAMANLHFQDLLPPERVAARRQDRSGIIDDRSRAARLRTGRPARLLQRPAPQRL